ncbi:MAG: sporulation transcriptional regulator SpoIIID [Clostridia bacterium]|nr:sporulation transcriptional regulator SpoIIID [Clostridia bacterium]
MDAIKQRVLTIGTYIAETNATVREAAALFGVSKSSVHKDMTERLEDINPGLYEKVRKVLDVNKAERHLRGGMATKEKYLKKKSPNDTTR